MHASSYLFILLGATASLTHGYLHSLHQAAQQPSWRSLISMGPDAPSSRQDYLVRCGAQMTGPTAPSANDKVASLRTEDLAIAQNALMAYCARPGARIPSSGSTIGHVQRHGGVFVQLCNLTNRPIRCGRQEVKALFEAMQCGSRETPQMGLSAPVSSGQSLAEADYMIVLGPRGAEADCRATASARREDVGFTDPENVREL